MNYANKKDEKNKILWRQPATIYKKAIMVIQVTMFNEI